MDKDRATKTVVQGEASESDEEDDKEVQKQNAARLNPFPSRFLQSKHRSQVRSSRKVGGVQAVVVVGEASESEEEEVDTSASEHGSPEITPLRVDTSKKFERGSSSDLSDVPVLLSPRMAESRYNKPKYDTLLHRKLREDNLHLHEHLVEISGQAYLNAARSLTATTASLAKSHTVVQDISHSMRLLTNDLFHLDDRIDIIQSCKLLPTIRVPSPAQPSQAEAASPQRNTNIKDLFPSATAQAEAASTQ